jgi:t-SNARE complex subunit (syntaxin)
LELKDDDPPLLRLKKERFNAALKEVKARYDLYDRGLTRIPELIDVGERLFAAEADLYDDDPEKKAEALQRQLDVYTEAETNLQKQVKNGLATQADLERLRYDKLTVQINLFKAKNPSAR